MVRPSPSLFVRLGQSALPRQRRAPPLRRRHRRPKLTDDGALSLGAAAAKQKPKMVSIPLVRQSALVSSAEGKCLPVITCTYPTRPRAYKKAYLSIRFLSELD